MGLKSSLRLSASVSLILGLCLSCAQKQGCLQAVLEYLAAVHEFLRLLAALLGHPACRWLKLSRCVRRCLQPLSVAG